MADRDAAKQLILKILAISGGWLEAKSRLNKAFYAALLIYWREHKEILSDYPIVKLPNGPGIDGLDSLLAELEDEGAIEIVEGMKGPYPQTTIRLKTPVQLDPNEPEYEAIRRAVAWVKHHTTAQLSRITHQKPSYEAQPRMGYEQAIYLDALTDDEYQDTKAACAEVDDAFRAALEPRS